MIRKIITISLLLMFVNTGLCSEYRPYISTRLAKAIFQNSDIPSEDEDKAICDGSGFITHGDGHRTKCPGCSACTPATPVVPVTPVAPVKPVTPVTPVVPVVKECSCGCGKLGCTCQSGGGFSKCPMLPKPKVEESTPDEVPIDVLSHIMIYSFGAEWCIPCKKLKIETWEDPEVKRFLKDNKIELYIFDADNREHSSLFKEYKVESIPTVFVLNRDHVTDPKRRLSGFFSKSSILSILKNEMKDD